MAPAEQGFQEFGDGQVCVGVVQVEGVCGRGVGGQAPCVPVTRPANPATAPRISLDEGDRLGPVVPLLPSWARAAASAARC